MSKTTIKTTSMNVRLDVGTRQQLQALADDLGIPATSLVVANIKQMLRSGEVRLTTTLEPTPYLEEIMRRTDKDIADGKNLSGPFDTVEAMLADLNS
jgi:DNA-damage-inducible protein J